MWKYYQPNPCGRSVGDCAIRALSKALNLSWEDTYNLICRFGYNMCDMPSSDSVWGAVLRSYGFYKSAINSSYNNYTAEDFCYDNPVGIFVLGFGGHVATVVNGNIYDSWDCSRDIPIYVWYKKQ